MINIRKEQPEDYKKVEQITRKAFWNLYVPGCNEHYLVHIMRSHEDFVPELDLVIEIDGQIVGNIMYTRAILAGEAGEEKKILTFGPVSISPEHQRKGYGKMLMERSFELAVDLGYDVIVIFGNPGNYVSLGFVSCVRHNVCLDEDVFPSSMLVKELKAGALDGRRYVYLDSPVMRVDEKETELFDSEFEKMEKRQTPNQEEFFILSHSVIKS